MTTRRDFLKLLGVLAGVATAGRAQAPIVGLYAGPGTWREGRAAIRNFLSSLGLRWEELSPWAVDHLDPRRYRVLWFPGGWAEDYKQWISAEGVKRIREFVAQGGSYMGSCAGAYFASDFIIWEGERYEYDLDLFAGFSRGPISAIALWPQWALTPVVLEAGHPINAGAFDTLEMLYYGGQVFVALKSQEQGVAVAGSWGASAGEDGAGRPAIITLQYQEGKVLLFGPHPEIGYDFSRRVWDLQGGHGAQWPWLSLILKRWCACLP